MSGYQSQTQRGVSQLQWRLLELLNEVESSPHCLCRQALPLFQSVTRRFL
uniref:Uncharacterized protein n=1 Tax=Amphimedon queenslandica TaxID=400682 RepID=A0A1X7VT78_AMPQE